MSSTCWPSNALTTCQTDNSGDVCGSQSAPLLQQHDMNIMIKLNTSITKLLVVIVIAVWNDNVAMISQL